MSNRLAIFISSFDGCSDLWNPFFQIWDSYWSDCNYPINLINNEMDYSHKKINVINTGKEVDWFYRNITALESIQEKYVLFMLEDYFISKKIYNDDIEEILDYMDKRDIYYYQLSKGNMRTKAPVRVVVNSDIDYPISLQLAIWRRDDFIKILKEINGKTPWDVENFFINKYKGTSGVIKGVCHDTRDLFGYKNGVLRGTWILDTVKYYKKNGIALELGSRKVMSKKQMNKYKLAVFIHKRVPKSIRNLLKKVLNKANVDYLK